MSDIEYEVLGKIRKGGGSGKERSNDLSKDSAQSTLDQKGWRVVVGGQFLIWPNPFLTGGKISHRGCKEVGLNTHRKMCEDCSGETTQVGRN